MNKFLMISAVFFIPLMLHGAPVAVTGTLNQWGVAILTLDGVHANEEDVTPNPFKDYLLIADFKHEDGEHFKVQGYFAADGKAGETSATEGTKWRVHFSPNKVGKWSYQLKLLRGDDVAIDLKKQRSADVLHRTEGNFVASQSKGKGRLQYVGQRYLKHSGSGEYFLKAGADAPETFLGYAEFDGTTATNPKKCKLKYYKPHIKDWRTGDPSWQNGKGKGIIGAINYLSATGANAFSFLPYNAGGDGDNVWPHVSRSDKLHFDCSKLDQWGIVFDHGNRRGMYLHFKLQETENDDGKGSGADQALDGGELGAERKLYLRELIARYAHYNALNWNLGEENTQTNKQQRAMISFIREVDPYDNLIVVHTYPNKQEDVYGALLGNKNALTGVSIQNSDVAHSHGDALKWVKRSEKSGHPWVVAIDEPGTAQTGMPPDPDYPGMDDIGELKKKGKNIKLPTIHDVRKQVLWGVLMAGGAGVEYYFGYKLPQNDLLCEDWRSRDQSWRYCKIALTFFRENKIPFHRMSNRNDLVGNIDNTNELYCFAEPGEIYLVYLAEKETATLNMKNVDGTYSIKWYNPRKGRRLRNGSIRELKGGSSVSLGYPPNERSEDWLAVVRSNSR